MVTIRLQAGQSLLKEARIKREWTQEEVADKLQVSVDTIRHWESGRHLPYQINQQKLCVLFQMTPEELGLVETKRAAFPSRRSGTPLTTSNLVSFPVVQLSNACPSDNAEVQAAWKVHIELVTRISTAPLAKEALLREALNSLYILFRRTRTIIRNCDLAAVPPTQDMQPSFGCLAVSMLNTTLRPFLTKWHPLLRDYEDTRPGFVGRLIYEQQWKRSTELRQELNEMQNVLLEYSNLFAQMAGRSLLNRHPTQ